ncbi:MAG: iron-containing alcohol dehydrogenase [Synergistaceae bacterium]|nr:iron-containing alcohol dehydrogenase [Synergistaceae bacterium]
MLDFDFYSPTRILFGRGKHKEAGALVAPLAKKVLLHYGGGSLKRSGIYKEITSSLRENGVGFVELGGVVPNPRLSLVRAGVELCRSEGVDLILAAGGGSVIDSAKAIAMGACHDEDVWDFFEGNASAKNALPLAVVLTIPAAGSESSPVSVISNEEKKLKIGYHCDLLRPFASVVNPELFFTLPKNQIANGVADMMSHIFERYFTNTAHTDLTDGLCEAALRTIIKNAPLLMDDQRNYDAWAEIAFSSTLAHNGLLGMGREEDWASHRIEHQLSAVYDIAHGAGLAVIIPFWMEYVCGDNAGMFAQFAMNVMGAAPSRDIEGLAAEGIARLRAFFSRLGLPSSLCDFGIDGRDFEFMAKNATGAAFGAEKPLGGLKKLLWQDVLEIYRLAV